MIKKIPHLCVWLMILVLDVPGASAQLFGNDQEMNQIARDLKKVNARLVEIILPELRNIKEAQGRMKSNQANLSAQIDQMANRLPNILGTMEQSNAEVGRQVKALEERLGALESRLQENLSKQTGSIKSSLLEFTRNQEATLSQIAGTQQQELSQLINGQKAEMNLMKASVGEHLANINQALAAEMETLAGKNQAAIDNFLTLNRQNLSKSESLLNNQNQQMGETIKIMREMVRLENENRDMIVQNLSAVRAAHEASNTGFTQIQADSRLFDEKNKKMIEVIQGSLQDQQALVGQINVLAGNLTRANENINSTKAAMVKLKEILDQKLAEISKTEDLLRAQSQQSLDGTHLVKQNLLVADEKLNKLADGMKALQVNNGNTANTVSMINDKVTQMGLLVQQTDQKFVKLIDTTQAVVAQSAKLGHSLDQTLQKLDVGQSDSNLTNAKVVKLIEILKTIAEEQGKLAQILSGQEGLNQALSATKVELSNAVLGSHADLKKNLVESTNAINQAIVNSQTELGKYVTNSKVELGQFVAGSQGEVKQMLKVSHEETKEALEDLRKKANVNISRNDNILEALTGGKKSSAKK